MIVLRTGASDGCSLIRLIPVDIKKANFSRHIWNTSNSLQRYYYIIVNALAVVVIKTKHDFMVAEKHGFITLYNVHIINTYIVIDFRYLLLN